MAGSLNHIIAEDGTFMMDLIENIGDAHEALDECFKIIMELSEGDIDRVNAACEKWRLPKISIPMRPGGDNAL